MQNSTLPAFEGVLEAFELNERGEVSWDGLVAALTGYLSELKLTDETLYPENVQIPATLVFNQNKLDYAKTSLKEGEGFLGGGLTGLDKIENIYKSAKSFNSTKGGLLSFIGDIDAGQALKGIKNLVDSGDMESVLTFFDMVNQKLASSTPLTEEEATTLTTLATAFGEVAKMGTPESLEALSPLSDALKIKPEDLQTYLSDMTTNGEKLGAATAEGVDKGLTDHDSSTAASTFAQNVEDDLRAPDAFNSNSPAKKTEPVGEDAAAGVGEGMKGYDFKTNANTTATNVNTKLTSATVAKLASWKARGAYIAAGVGKGMAGYDFAADAKKMVENAQQAIIDASGEGSPAKEFIPRGYWDAAGVGKGLTKYDYAADAEASMESLAAALGNSRGIFDIDELFGISAQDSKLQEFARRIELETRVGSPAGSRGDSRKQTMTAKVDINYDLLAEKLADANTRRPVAFAVGSRELAQATVNDNSRTLTENDRRVRAGYGG